MRKARFALALTAASAALLPAGCGDSDSDDGAAGAAGRRKPASFSQEDVRIGNLLAQARGHHRAALERYEGGDRKAAVKHARHPAKEVLDSIRPKLAEQDPEDLAALVRALGRVPTSVAVGAPAARFEANLAAAAAATRDAEQAVVGNAAASDAYRGSVITALVAVAAREYEEALGGKRIRRLDEYQDAYGFLREASAMYGQIAPAVEKESAAEAAEIDEAFEQLEQALPSGKEPRRTVSLERVERSATLIGAELEETVGAKREGETDPREVRENIDRLLDEVEKTYSPEQTAGPAELVAEAYLENYEGFEGAVIDAAPKVNAELEPLLGAELRRRIRAGADPAVVAGIVERAKQLLAQAVRAVEAAE